MNRSFFARPLAQPPLGMPWFRMLTLVALLMLAGCGGSTAPEGEAEATVYPTATLVATLVAPTATPVPAQPTESAEAIVTEEATEAAIVEATGEATAESTVEATSDITQTETTTATGEVTSTPEITITTEVTVSEETTSTAEGTPSAEITTTAEVSESEQVTRSEVTATEEVTGTGASTETTGFAPSAGVTATATVTTSTPVTDARVYFLQPTTNAVVPVSFTVVMSYTGLTVAPAGENVADAGHMHIMIDSDFIEAGETIPNDELHRHFGDGSTTAQLELPPGSHVLRLQYADNNHIALEGDQYRHEIVVNVDEGAPEQAVRFVTPTSGATVPLSFTVAMAATGINVEPAGPVSENAGHFHILIDKPYVNAGEIIPMDSTHLHFGKGQLTTTVTLEPGPHLLRLQLADGAHRALKGNQYRAEIEVIASEQGRAEQVMFVKPADHATVTSPFLVGWAASGLIIEAAGQSIRPGAGHLHLLINEEFIPAGESIPRDDTHLHFGAGQTNTQLTLEPGEYTLRLQMSNGVHVAHQGPQYQDEITVTVK